LIVDGPHRAALADFAAQHIIGHRHGGSAKDRRGQVVEVVVAERGAVAVGGFAVQGVIGERESLAESTKCPDFVPPNSMRPIPVSAPTPSTEGDCPSQPRHC
jgi:hypothetical protein